ncbi:hypothetical protein JCM33374_g509 [Metschnikowia sp. JCM 33374]|nr:hypothetical protein JCM33374_g509 [Metschnikowia sp. JCM 33374]
MYMNTGRRHNASTFEEYRIPAQVPLNYVDELSPDHSRRIKRARLTREAIPPSSSGVSKMYASPQRRSCIRSRDSMIRSSVDFRQTPRTVLKLSSEASESDSLPDLSDSASTTCSIQSAITPRKLSVPAHLVSPNTSRNISSQNAKLVEAQHAVTNHSIFDIPELVYKIIEYADLQNLVSSQEKPPVQRTPLSSQHRNSSHNEESKYPRQASDQSHQSNMVGSGGKTGTLHTCLLVNKLFNRIAKEIMATRILFSNEAKFSSFADSQRALSTYVKPEVLVLNRLFQAKQASLDKIAEKMDFTSLHSLEIFMCPRLKPESSFLHPSLKKFTLAGSNAVDDSTMVLLADRCPNLEVLDVRACEKITDYGIYAISKKCHKLRSINFGRSKEGDRITDLSITKLVSSNPNLETVGLAGCHITDRSIWQLAMSAGRNIKRLSLNKCIYLTDQSVPVALGHNLMPELSVLEIRFIENITNFEPIVTFKRKQSNSGITMLIETCETLAHRLQACENEMDNYVPERILQDISEWANKKDDEDISYEEFMRVRGSFKRAN